MLLGCSDIDVLPGEGTGNEMGRREHNIVNELHHLE
jgi:hypothetical protein